LLMNGLLTAVIVYLILNAMVWTLRHISVSRARQQSSALDSRYPTDSSAPWPKVSLLVAGKNEEKNIERCLRSLVAQNYPNLEVIAINDRSTDRTGQIMDRVAAESGGRLTVVHITDLPADWLGKPHAMHEGQKRATGEYLVFTDADCFFQCPDAVRIAVAYAREHGVDLLSVLPVLETSSLWERILQPVCSAVLIIWFRPEWVNSPDCRTAYANGAFMLFSRACYQAVGGHPQVKAFLMEDMEFARLAKESGRRLYVVQNRDLYRTRMYEDFRTTFAGWSRIFYGSFRRSLYVAGAALVLLAISLLPYLILLGALGVATVKGWDVHRLGWFILAWSGLAIAAQMSVIMRFYPLMGAKWYRALTYPVGASVTFAILLNALTKFRGGKIVWRGSEVRMKGI
jgi:cellulose synthase/poly-beta-1,6-N-acetylglucosamine synthase-like glycosyltransferase